MSWAYELAEAVRDAIEASASGRHIYVVLNLSEPNSRWVIEATQREAVQLTGVSVELTKAQVTELADALSDLGLQTRASAPLAKLRQLPAAQVCLYRKQALAPQVARGCTSTNRAQPAFAWRTQQLSCILAVMTQKPRVLTGIRSNGTPHLGNYLGAILPMVEIQKTHGKTHEMLFFVPDLHSFTTPIDHASLYQHTLRNLKYFAAAGMDFWAEGAYLYRQSYISAHSELTWILDCFTHFGEMRRMTQFKDKSALETTELRAVKKVLDGYNLTGRIKKLGQISDHPVADLRNLFILDRGEAAQRIVEELQKTKTDTVSVGLFNYPVLMAADILLYNATFVPVGDDQRQHLEITRDLGLRLNNQFAELYPEGLFATIPLEWDKQLEFAKRDSGVRIRSLRNPLKKMAKSVSDPAGTILMTDDPASAAKKVLSATTDSLGAINFDWQKQPGVTNLLQMLALLQGQSINQVITQWQGKTRYGDLKKAVAEEVESLLHGFQKAVKKVDEKQLLAKLEQDETYVRSQADQTLLRVQQAVGLRPRLKKQHG